MTNANDVFVVMPFSSTASYSAEQWTEIYELVFKTAIESAGFTCERAAPETGSLIGSIVSKLRHARIVLADITDRNSNVFYELGVRHSLSKRTIIVTQNSDDVPSDLRGYWFIKYGISPKQVIEFKKEIARLIGLIENAPDKPDNPISVYLEQEKISISTVINRENIKKLGALYTEFTGNLAVLRHDDPVSRYQLLSADCLRLLLQTQYLDLGSELLKDLYELNNKLKLIQLDRLDVSVAHLVDTAIPEIERLGTAVLSIRNQLAKDQYREPDTVSLMVWKPGESDLKPPGCDEIAREYFDKVESSVRLRSRCLVCGGTGVSARGSICVVCGQAG